MSELTRALVRCYLGEDFRGPEGTPMFKRISRVFRSFVGFFISIAEDPELILEQNIRDLNDRVPAMNESIAMVRANVTLLEKENAKATSEAEELTSKIKAALRQEREDLAANYAVKLESAKKAQARSEGQLEGARNAYEKAIALKKQFMREKERRSREALDAIRAHKRAQWQAKVADALEGFEMGAIDATHEEMLRRVEEKTALNEARMEVALDSLDQATLSVEEDAERIRAEETVRKLKLEMAEEETLALERGKTTAKVEEESTEKVGAKVAKVEAK